MQYRSGLLAPVIAMALSMYSMPAAAQPSSPDMQPSLFEKSIEELMNIEVQSAGRKPQKLDDAATAITVITQEDIRRSGMNSIPELLRMVPGLQVAQIEVLPGLSVAVASTVVTATSCWCCWTGARCTRRPSQAFTGMRWT